MAEHDNVEVDDDNYNNNNEWNTGRAVCIHGGVGRESTTIANRQNINSKFEFTNIKCISLDNKYAEFEYCFLKSINRTYKYGSVKVNFHQIPVKQFTINLAMYKRLNGYKPFLYNITVNGCRFLASIKSNPVATYFYDFIKPYTNLNHTCPYKHDILVEKVPTDFINHRLTKVLPFPEGDYLVHSIWIAAGVHRVELKVYGTLS
ncbi:uncharacterized protein LOC124459785 [Drosophila willistoni]|uniref:uncharacterized protein LOC124459785 n=1 Tax=Drosophila willistoni TaxID=7260 RepID=UPI001F07A043|nr:uncharacterized protein LOC124459785 [Drosophila willistoni]